MQIQIRGGIGTQVLSFLIEVAKYGNTISQVIHGFGGYTLTPERRLKESSVGVAHLESVLDIGFDLKFTSSQSTTSTPITDSNICLLADKISDVRALVKQKKEPSKDHVFHVRTFDSQLLSKEDYKRMCNLQGGFVISDNYNFVKEMGSFKIPTIDDTNSDWVIAANAKNLYGPFSTFTLAAAIINPDISLNLVPHKYYNSNIHGRENRLRQVSHLNDVFVDNFENINYMRI